MALVTEYGLDGDEMLRFAQHDRRVQRENG